MENKNLTINISTVTILKVVGILLLLFFAYFIRDIILMVFLAIIFAALIEPVVSFLEKYRVPRFLGVVLVYVILLLFIVLAVRLIIPPIAEQVSLLTVNFPYLWEKMAENFSSFSQYAQEQNFVSNIQQNLQVWQAGLQRAASGLYSVTVYLFSNLINLIFILVITFYLLIEKNLVHDFFQVIAPSRYHDYLVGVFSVVAKKVGDWARGQLILSFIIGFLSFVGLLYFLPKYALVLALVAGVTEIIPYVGPILGAIPAVFLGFTVPDFSIWRGIGVLILYIVIQQLENNVIVPQVMKRQVGINPIVTIIVMLIGAKIAGIVGIILVIPITIVISVIIKDIFSNSGLKNGKPLAAKQNSNNKLT
ncbi:MAG: AI-2E family transporter [Patescibacteria group bacterium]|jgi:predicted PurR-regulated permease PerM